MLLAGGHLRAGAQSELVFHRLSLEDGLSDTRITAIAQDKYGFMWFGTSSGLDRYDGYSIRVYEEGGSGLSGDAISALFASKTGHLYASDGHGLLEYDFAADSFRRPPGTDSLPLNAQGYHVTLMAEDTQGRIYLGCAREGLHRFDPRAGSIENLNEKLRASRITHISGLTFGADGRLWITTQKRGFFVVDPAQNTWQEIPQAIYPGVIDTCCAAVHRTVFLDNERLLMGQHSMGLLLFNTRTQTFTKHHGMLSQSDSVRFNSVFRLIKDYRGRVWAGTAYFGLVQYLPATGAEIIYRHDVYNPASYGGYRVSALFEDRDHNIWVGTAGYGVYRFHPDKTPARHYPWFPNGDRTPPGPEVLSSATNDTTSVWIGTDRGPAIFNFRTGDFRSFPYQNAYSPVRAGNNIVSIFRDRKGLFWMASRALGISVYDPRSGTFRRYRRMGDAPFKQYGKPMVGAIPGSAVRSIAEDDNGNLLFLIEARITAFDPRTRTAHFFLTDSTQPLLRLKDVTDFLTDGQGNLVYSAGSDDTVRLFRYSFRTGVSTLLAKLHSEPAPTLNRLYRLPSGDFAAATSHGVFVVARNGGLRRHYVWKGPGRRDRITGLAPDGSDGLWVCTDRYVGRLNLRTADWRWLGAGDGLKPSRFFGDALRVLPDGRLLVGSSDGLFVLNTAQVARDGARSRPPILTSLMVSGKPFFQATPLQETREISLSHEQNFFSFSMSTLSFGESAGTEYEYMLEGFDRDWQKAGPDRTGQYTGIRGGVYKLRMRAKRGGGEWSASLNPLSIKIGKPWWNTWTARGFAALAIAGVVAGFYFYRVRSIRKEARLHSDYEIRLNELETNALRTQMNPHFIFNCLNTINSYINSNQKAEANHYITRFAKLIRLILENSRKRRVALSSDLEALKLYMLLEQIRFENRFDFSIETSGDLDADNLEVPPLVLQPFVENALLHGILPADRSGVVTVRVQPAGEVVRYIVEDDGIGRAEAARRQREGVLRKESHGMAITMKRIELFNREEGVMAQVEVQDLLDERGQPRGTRVVVPLALVECF